MAEKNPVPDNSLNCSICLDPFKDPRVLPCCHIFCKDCLERTFQQQTKPPKKYPANSMLKISALPLLPSDFSAEKPSARYSLGPPQAVLSFQPVDANLSLPTTLEATPTPEQTLPTVPPQEIPSVFELLSVKEEVSSVLVDKDEEEKPAVIRCPLCKAQHAIPEGGIESFSPDYSILQRIESEYVTKSLTKTNIKCGSCLEEDIVKEKAGVCDECHIICNNCVTLHKKLAVYKSHAVVPLSDYSPEKHVPKRKQQLCGAHRKEIVLYCNTCSQLICLDCVTRRHKDHEFVSLDEADETLCTTVRDMSESAKHTMTVFQRYREYIQGVETELGKDGYAAELKKRINARFEEHIRELQARREALIGQVEDNEVLAKKNLWAQRDHINSIIAKIETGMRFTERALKCSNTTERIKMSKQGKEVLSKVTDAKWDHESIPPPLVYRCKEEVDILLSFGEVSSIHSGDIQVQLEDDCEMGILKSVRKSKRIEVELEKPAIIKVKFLVPLIKAAALFIQILYGKRKQIFDTNDVVVYESEAEKSTWNVEFVPRCAGTHIVQVWVGGIPATNEEITVTGSLRVGSRVQPGPDWEGPLTLTVGRVVKFNAYSKTVRVDWSGNEEVAMDNDEPMEHELMDDQVVTKNANFLAETIEPYTLSTATFGGDLMQHTSAGNVRQHKWGDSYEYEVELVL